jgi:hypothetical protein
MVAAPHKKKHQNDVNKSVHTGVNWVQNNSIFLNSVVNLTKINKNLITALFTLKMTVTATKLTVHMKAAKMK